MKRKERLGVLIGSGIFASALVIWLANYFIVLYDITGPASEAAIVGGVLTFLGTIFSAVYKEMSSYYNDKSINASKKWDLVFPFIKKHYNPWINSASSLRNAINSLDREKMPDNQVIRILFLVLVFYGYRLKFILQDGGLILLSSIEDEDKVMKAYRELEKTFSWAGNDTPNRVSELQHLFVSKDKPENPYVLTEFQKDLLKSASLLKSREDLKAWISNGENVQNLEKKLDDFITIFKTSIHKLYKVWDD